MAKLIVCPVCEGKGSVLNPEIAGAVFTSDDIDNDPDFFCEMKQGVYDVICSCCHGRNVVTRAEYNRWQQDTLLAREDRLEYLRESGIGPGHRDYY